MKVWTYMHSAACLDFQTNNVQVLAKMFIKDQ